MAHDVVAVGGEVRRGERQRPRCSTGCRAPVLASVREGRAVPELVVRLALDRDLDAVDRCPAGVRRGSAEAGPAGVVVAGGGREGERGARIGQVDRPGEARRRQVGVAGRVGRAHLEGVRAGGEARVALRRRARSERAAVELAVEGRAGLVGREGEARARRVRGIVRLSRDRGVGADRVDRERAGQRGLDVAGGVGRANAHRVVAVAGEVARGERERPRGGSGGEPPVLRAVGEGGAVPVLVVRVALDRDLDRVERGAARVGGRAAEVVPGRGVVEAGCGREGDRRARVGRVDRPGEAGGGRVGVAGGVGGAHLEGVRALGQAGIALRRAAGGPAAAVELALEGRAALGRAEREAWPGDVRGVVRLGGDRGVRRGGVDRPGEARGSCVGVACGVGRADLEGVRAVAEPGVALRAGAGGPGATVDPALERRRALTRAEGEVGGGGVARVAGLGGDRGVRRGGVDRPGVGRGGRVGVACGVGRAHLEGVRAVG